MITQIHDITVKRGADFKLSLTLQDGQSTPQPIDLTGATLISDIKEKFYLPIVGSFTITVTNPTGGLVDLEMDASETLALPDGFLEYDVFLKASNGVITKVLKGKITSETTDSDVATLLAP